MDTGALETDIVNWFYSTLNYLCISPEGLPTNERRLSLF